MNSEDQIAVTLIDNDLPEGWALPRISDLIEINYGKGLKESDRKVGPVPVYGSNGVVGNHNASLSKGSAIIVGRKGSVGFVHFSLMPCWPIDTTYYIDKFNGLNPQFLMYALRTLDLADLDTSTAIPGLNRNDVYMQKIPLPPLNEQKRIVAKVEELLTRVNATKERLAKVSLILKRFRQAVLAAACSGRLTSDWREKQSYIQHAKDLLLSILAERRKFMQESNPKKRGAPESLHPYREAWDVDPSEFEELPDGWVWASGEDLFAWSSGDFLPKKKQEKGPYPIYGGNGITGYHSEYLVDHPTLVIGRVGALCGNVYITSDKAWITDNAIYASYVPTKLNLQYVKMVFTQSNLNANAGGSGQPFVNQTVLSEVPRSRAAGHLIL
jgi:type I restriction enzyme S subunit